MKKRLLLLVIGLFLPMFMLAATFPQISTDLEDTYQKHSLNLSNVYKDTLNDYEELVNTLEGEDYINLGKVENIDVDSLKTFISDSYLALKKEIYSKKSELELDLELLKERKGYGLVTEQELEDLLSSLDIDVSSYDAKYTAKISSLRDELLTSLSDYKEDLDQKLIDRGDDLEKISNFESKLTKITENYIKLKDYYSDLENITSISKDIIDKNGDTIKQDVLDLLDERLTEKYEYYLEKDEDFVYYEVEYKKKKQIMIDYMEGQINTFWLEQMEDIYEGVDMSDIENKFLKIEIYDKNYDELLKNYDSIIDKMGDLEIILAEAISIFENRINSYSEDGDVNNQAVRENIQEETVNYFESTFEEVKGEMDTFFEASKEILSYRKEVEQEKYNQLVADYNKTLLDQQDDEIEAMKKEIAEFKEGTAVSQNVIEKNKKMLWQLEIALIDSKILSLGLTDYFEQYGDLSNIVYNFLLVKKAEYEDNGKGEKFAEKIDKAYKKIGLLEEGLKNDRTSFYILMIKKGIILYYMD